MRSPSRLAATALLLASTLLLSGCVPPDPEVTPPPEQATAPLFASDEEALAAATEAYEAYLKMSDLIAQEGGANPERLVPFVTGEWLEREVEASRSIEAAQRHLEGSTSFDSLTLQQLDQSSDGTVIVVVYVCVDLTNAWLVESDGRRVTENVDSTRWPFEVTLESSGDSLLIGGHEEWRSSAFC